MATIPAIRQVRGQPQQVIRCSAGQDKQASQCTTGFAANGFLRHRFLPLYEQPQKLPAKAKSEASFFQSLALLAGCYGLETMDVSGKPYPYNLLLAFWDAQRQLDTHQPVRLSIVQTDDKRVSIETTQVYDTGHQLYYIPVLPLYRLLQKKRHRKAGELLLSVCAYLYKVVCVPYYRDDDTDIGCYYEMLQEWAYEDERTGDETGNMSLLSQLNAAAYYGDDFQRKIYNSCHLTWFAQRIAAFQPQSDFDWQCLHVAEAAYELYCKFPDRRIFDHAGKQWEAQDEYDECNVARMEQYISFIAEGKGWLYDELYRMVNDSLNECSVLEEPQVTELFDGTHEPSVNRLDFEQQFFPMVIDLCTLLMDL